MIEAITEDVNIKSKVFGRLGEELPERSFSRRTRRRSRSPSSRPAHQRPERVLGLHFFSPVPVMKLVEVVTAIDTAQETIEAAESFAGDIGKHPIRTKDRSGSSSTCCWSRT